MPEPMRPPAPDPARFTRRLGELRGKLARLDPDRLAIFTGTGFQPGQADQGQFTFSFWSRTVSVSYPAFVAHEVPSGKALSDMNQAMLLYYFSTADGFPLSNRWISFAELPDGRFYTRAFQSYTGHELGRHFASAPNRFESAAASLGGQPSGLGNLAYSFQILPRVNLLIVFWLGDEDFPASFQVLFDESASHYLPTDAYAILGSTLTHRLIAASDVSPSAKT